VIRLVEEAQPERYGLLFGFWTVALLCAYLARELALSLGESTVRRVLHAAGFVWRRPKLIVRPSAHEPEGLARQWAIVKAVIEAGPETGVVYVDECDVQLLPVVRAMWMRRGQQVRVPTPGTNRKFSVFGGLDIRSGVWYYRVAERKLAAHFVGFLEQLVKAYEGRPLIVIADNAGPHSARVVQRWLAEHPQVRLLFLPKYSPHLNPVEKVWWQLKREISANRCYGDVTDLVEAVHRFFGELSPQAALRLAA
jgi:transposase